MNNRSINYKIIIVMKDGWIEESAFSRKDRALRRAKEISQTWKNWGSIKVIDSKAVLRPQLILELTA